MALMTTAECRDLLGISGFDYDESIATYLPYVEDDIIAYLGHAFQDGYVYRESGSKLEFVRDTAGGDYITDEDNEFLVHGFRSGIDIVIEGGWSNVGLYHVSSASTGKLLLSEKGELIPQDQNDTTDDHHLGTIRISRVAWPKALKLAAAKMVWHLIKNMQADRDVQSESLDDYSVTYAGMSFGYPKNVLKMLDKWRRVTLR